MKTHAPVNFCSQRCAILLVWLASLVCGNAQALQFNTYAGYAGKGYSDGAATNALFHSPQAVAADSSGNLYVADSGNNVIRKITPSGTVSTLAGTAGVTGSNDGSGSGASFNQPGGIAVDTGGNVYVCDSGNSTVRKITSLGVVTTLAGTAGTTGSANGTGAAALFNQPAGLAVDSATNLYVADYGNNIIRKITLARVVTTLAGTAGAIGGADGAGPTAQFYQPQGVTVDSGGNVYVADTANGTIRKITSAGVVTTLAGTAGTYGSVDTTGPNALFYQPYGIAVDSTGNLYVSDYFNQTIRKVTSSAVVTTLCGLPQNFGSADGTGNNARFWGPEGIAISGGALYVADSGNETIRMVTTNTDVVSTFAGSPSAGSANGATPYNRLNAPQSIAADSSGNIYVADTQNSTI